MAAEWGDTEWKDDEKVRILQGENVEPWKTWNDCCGAWKFPNGLMQFLIDAGFKCPTPIQAYTWPALMENRDVIGVAKTGSGKTLGYLLPGYIKVKREEMSNTNFKCDQQQGPAMLVVSPTRELCQQIYDESIRFGAPAQIRTSLVFGGAPKGPQVRGLYEAPHCVCATPGRLNDFLENRTISLGQCFYLVLDEADRMLDMGFEPQIRKISQSMPQKRQTALFTATWPKEVRKVAETLTQDATHIQVGSSDSATTNADITQHIIKVRNEADKMKLLETTIFQKLQTSGGAALIFVKTKKSASSLFYELNKAGAPIVCLHGDMEQHDRDKALWAFKAGKAKVLVATDVAQRGLDIKNVEIVVNYDPPANMEDYVHRIGRTGRAGAKGDAYTCLRESEVSIAQDIAKVMRKVGQEVPPELKEMVEGGGYGGRRVKAAARAGAARRMEWRGDDKSERHAIFAAWIARELLPRGPQMTHSRVLDVAGGKGHLSSALVQLGHRVALVDPCALKGRALYSDTFGTDSVDAAAATAAAATAAAASSDPLVVLRHTLEHVMEHVWPSCVADCAAIVGLHPDEPTEAIVQAALAHGKPFAVVPCCAFGRLFQPRKMASGGGVRKLTAFVAYLQEKDPRIRRIRLPFVGKSEVLFMTADDYLRPRQFVPRPNYTPCSLAAKRGDLDKLRTLRAEGHPWSEEVCQAAAWGGHVDVLEWALEQGCPWDWRVVVEAAASGERVCVLEWARTRSPIDARAGECALASEG